MNKIEKYFNDFLGNNVKMKKILKNGYQLLFVIIPKKKIKSRYSIIMREGYFFGFHDKKPFSKDNQYLLAHKILIDNRKVRPNDRVGIGYFCGENLREFKKISESNTWNWQQGAMLQWVGEEKKIIFNYFDGTYKAKIYDLYGNLIKKIDFPIGCVSNSGKFATSFSFERLEKGMPGYGYLYNCENSDSKSVKNTGLFLIDLDNNDKHLIISLEKIKKLLGNDHVEGFPFVTHTLFSPDDSRILFLYRVYRPNRALFTKMISCDLNGDNIFIFPTSSYVSHISWVGNKNVLAYCSLRNKQEGYILFKDGLESFAKKVSNKKYSSDGHPQFNDNVKLVVTDTYPNRQRIQELSIFNIENSKKLVLADLYSPWKYRNEIRCDLHPRWDFYGSMICFDSSVTGTRALCTIKLDRSDVIKLWS